MLSGAIRAAPHLLSELRLTGLGKRERGQVNRLIGLLGVLLLAACQPSALPSTCTDGCIDTCRNAKFGKAKDCAREYANGYSLGYADGRRGELTDGINTDYFVAGYWDGVADGQADR